MIIQTVELEKINPARYNPRKDLQPGDAEYDKLKKSILEFDMVEPLVWNKRTGNLVGGHQRLKVLKELGIEHVEVSVVDLSEVKEKALNLALNKISGEWDMPMLKDLLEELDTGDFDMEITGFDLKEIEDLMTQFHVPEEGLTDDDAVPEATESICRRGDLWQLGNHRLLCGDATVITDVERLMGGEKADMVFTDPPYNVAYSGRGQNKLGTIENDNLPEPEFKQFLQDTFGSLDFGMAGGTPIYLCHGDTGNNAVPFIEAFEIQGWTKSSTIIWVKQAASMGWQDYRSQHECIFYGWKAGDHYFTKDRSQTTIWDINRDGQSTYKHPTQKPVALSERAINNSSKVSQVVLDLFGGSGSTLIACEKLGRRCYMMEIDEHYCDVIIKRWQDFTGKEAVRIDD